MRTSRCCLLFLTLCALSFAVRAQETPSAPDDASAQTATTAPAPQGPSAEELQKAQQAVDDAQQDYDRIKSDMDKATGEKKEKMYDDLMVAWHRLDDAQFAQKNLLDKAAAAAKAAARPSGDAASQPDANASGSQDANTPDGEKQAGQDQSQGQQSAGENKPAESDQGTAPATPPQ